MRGRVILGLEESVSGLVEFLGAWVGLCSRRGRGRRVGEREMRSGSRGLDGVCSGVEWRGLGDWLGLGSICGGMRWGIGTPRGVSVTKCGEGRGRSGV